ncbi:MAG TPA: homoserine O-acetyltransferase [Anaeromyxobacteraceae bacterium]|nr:homoserine O-acetyltransferase [Anaeromyxobacteraceae bacterium]
MTDARAAARAAFVSPETRTLALPGAFELELGGALPEVQVGYRTWGTLDRDGANAVVICHALTGSADADRWWTKMFGPGRAFDPDRDFVICSNILGSCYGTTGPASIDPRTGAPYLGDFPLVTIRDMVRAQRELCRALGVKRIRLVVGGSLGGMQTLEWALSYPELVDSFAFIASSARHSAWCIGLSEAQRQAVYADPRWRGGRYDPADPPLAGLAAARMMAMCTYRSRESFEQRFARRPQTAGTWAVESYLRYQGQQLVDRFDAASYVALTRAMDTHDVARGRGEYEEVLRGLRKPALVVSIDTDVLYLPEEQREVAELVPGARLERIQSPHGHDAFLIDVELLDRMVSEFRGRAPVARPPAEEGRVEAVRAAGGGQEGVSLFVLGKGKVGSQLLAQLAQQRAGFERDFDVSLRVVGLADSRRTLFEPEGVDLGGWADALSAEPAAGPFDLARGGPYLERLGKLPHPVLVDLTAADGMEAVYAEAFRRGVDVVSANKRPLAADPRVRDEVVAMQRRHHRHFQYEATVGASLPLIGTLAGLRHAGDRVLRIEGSLSGTVGHVCGELMKGAPLSLAVRWARELGYTEADPRDDLSGLDTARKAVILARELGLRAAVDEVEREPLLPDDLLARPAAELLQALRWYDPFMEERVEALRAQGRVLRYLACIEAAEGGAARIRVAPAAVGPEHLAARLRGVEAYVACHTERYQDHPLLVQGAGVGAASTAGGVLADLFRLSQGHGAR